MKVVKIKSKYYKDLETMYKDLGLIEEDYTVDPSKVFVSKKDAKIMQTHILLKIKKKYPLIKEQSVQSILKMEWLNLGPSELLRDGVREGYLIIL